MSTAIRPKKQKQLQKKLDVMHVAFVPAVRWGVHGHSDLQSFARWKIHHIKHAGAADRYAFMGRH